MPEEYASYNKSLEILGISWNARQRPGKYCNLAKIVRIQSLPRHYMECQITDRHFLQRRGKWRKFAPFAPFSPSIATTACYARAARVHGWRMQTAHSALEKHSVSSPYLAGKRGDSVRVVRVQNNALLKDASAVRLGCFAQAEKWCCRHLVKLLNRFAHSLLAAPQHLHYWFKFRNAGFLCTSQCHLLMTCQQIKKAPFQLMPFSSENGKNKVVATRECKHSRTTKSLQKVPIVALAFHVMPRQPLYSDDFSQIPILAWPLPSNTWNA